MPEAAHPALPMLQARCCVIWANLDDAPFRLFCAFACASASMLEWKAPPACSFCIDSTPVGTVGPTGAALNSHSDSHRRARCLYGSRYFPLWVLRFRLSHARSFSLEDISQGRRLPYRFANFQRVRTARSTAVKRDPRISDRILRRRTPRTVILYPQD